MSLFGRKEKEEIERLKSQMRPEQVELADLQKQIEDATRELQTIKAKAQREQQNLTELKKQIIETDEKTLLQSFGFFTPHYQYNTTDEYKAKLVEIRGIQKELVKSKNAVTGQTDWTVNGNKAQGKKMVADMQKLLLRAFNSECDDAIEHIRFNNLESCQKKISASYEAISKLGTIMSISITPQYYRLKNQELNLMYEYQLKKQEEKDAMREAREKLREEAKLAKEIEAARKKLEKEQTHYNNAYETLKMQLATAAPEDQAALQGKIAEIEARLQTIEKDFQAVDYREANQRAGYVYVISNIGAFGENVYKIGMTRRLEPMDRVDELGDASVPFDFDVHAMIFTEDAPALEAALHNAFADRKLNFINTRREFFRVTLDEIKKIVKENFDKSVQFVDVAPAEQYRETMALKRESKIV